MFTNIGQVITGKLACCFRSWDKNCTAVSSRPSGFWRCWKRENCLSYSFVTVNRGGDTSSYGWIEDIVNLKTFGFQRTHGFLNMRTLWAFTQIMDVSECLLPQGCRSCSRSGIFSTIWDPDSSHSSSPAGWAYRGCRSECGIWQRSRIGD